MNNFDVSNSLFNTQNGKKISKQNINRQLTNMTSLYALMESNKEKVLNDLNSKGKKFLQPTIEENMESSVRINTNSSKEKDSKARNFTKSDFIDTCNNIVHDNNIIKEYMKMDDKVADRIFLNRKNTKFRENDIDSLDVDYLLYNKAMEYEKVVVHNSKQEFMISKKKAEMIRLTEALYKMDDMNFVKNFKNVNDYYSGLANDLEIPGYEAKPKIYETMYKSFGKLNDIDDMQYSMKKKTMNCKKIHSKHISHIH